MSKSSELLRKRDILKSFCLLATLAGTASVFILTPVLFYPTLIAMIVTTLLSPLVAALQRKGYSRVFAIVLIVVGLGNSLILLAYWGIHAGILEWKSFKEKAPQNFHIFLNQVRILELYLKGHYSFLKGIHPTDSLLKLGHDTGKWFIDSGPSLAGQFLSWVFLVPIISFVFLKDGRRIQSLFLYLVPNRFFESFFLITSEIATAISNYIRAKLIEALLVGLLVTLGLLIVGASNTLVLGLIAGATNIIPYLGPMMGAAPGILLAAFDSQHQTLIFWVVFVYFIANLIDTFVIFPLVVAKLINLHPLVLIITVIIGQRYYGLLGMLISVPIAASLKVIIQEIYAAIYDQRSREFRTGSQYD